jgi:hypothetical protein
MTPPLPMAGAPKPHCPPTLNTINRWEWTPPDQPLWHMLRRHGRARLLLETWLEDQICALVDLPPEQEHQLLEAYQPSAGEPESDHFFLATRSERLRLYKQASFTLLVEEHFSRTKRQRDRIIYSMLRCRDRARLHELALAIRDGELDFAAAAIRWSEGPESAQGGRIGPVPPDLGHPDLNRLLSEANPDVLIGPVVIGDYHVLLRLDHRLDTRLDEATQAQLVDELYRDWLSRQIDALLVGESLEPLEYLPPL